MEKGIGTDRPVDEVKRKAVAVCNEGYSLGLANDYQGALSLFEEALALDETLAVAWSNKGNALAKLGRLTEALACHEKAVDLKPSSYPLWVGWAETLILSHAYQEALEKADRAVRLSFKDYRPWLARANALANLDRIEEALQSYDKGISIDRKAGQVLKNKRALLMKRKRNEEALICNEKLLALDGDSHESMVCHGLLLEALHRDQEALGWYEKAAENNQTNAMIWISIGRLCERNGNSEKAIDSFNRALSIDPALHEARLHSIVLQGGGREDYFLKAIKDDPDARELYVELGHLYLSSIQAKKGEEFVDSALERFPGDAELLVIKGWLLAARREGRQSAEIFSAVLEKDRDVESAWFGLAYLFFCEVRYHEAEGAFREVLRINHAHIPSSYYLAILLALTGRYTEAIGLFRVIRDMDYTQYDVMPLIGAILIGQGKGKDAECHYRSMLADDGQNDEAVKGLISSLILQDRNEDAESLLARWNPPSAMQKFADFTGGCCAFYRGDQARADEIWKALQEDCPESEEDLFYCVMVCCLKGDTEKAALYCQKGYQSYRHNTFFPGLLGLLKAWKGEDDEAERIFISQIGLLGFLPQTHFSYGRHLFRKGRMEDACEEFRKALAPEEDSTSITLTAEGFLCYCTGDITRSRIMAEKVLGQDRRFADAHFLLGLIAQSQGMDGGEHFGQALRLVPYNCEYRDAQLKGSADRIKL